jgi:hypothetical protein
MASFARWMSPGDVEAVRAYVGARARILAASETQGG